MIRYALTAALLVVGCGSATDPGSGTSTTSTSTSTSTSTVPPPTSTLPERVPMTSPPITGEVPEEILGAVLDDASERAGVEIERLEVTTGMFVEWPDGSLGCPQPGEFYIQVIVPGYQIVVEGPDDVYDYRVDDRGNFRLCEQGLPIGGSLGTTPTTMGDEPSK